ncbi:nucleotide exchange factor GrpE [Mycoplasmopsis felis]|uniref:nucleotide exchange factor GrpE n=1 Tax=Mycoplasmopsis felis TaxID=33923 RepID=UPI002AFFA14A|nr:nucleotide exchange factor GrpE [Mycoplasmopsis felis]WQQ11560.1 nucleotide exchange factor GrpE [Mycoplasmopsis felis]
MFNVKKLQKGTKIKGDFELYLDNELILDYKKEDLELILGNNSYIDTFENFLIGRKYKEEMEVSYIYPKHHENEDLAGKSAKVIIKNLVILEEETLNNNNKIQELEKEIENKENELNSLREKISIKEYEIFKQVQEFKTKAQEITKKAQETIDKEKELLFEKLQKEKETIKQFALQNFLEDFMMPFNNLTMAVNAGSNSTSQEVKNYNLGFNIVLQQFENVFNNHNVELIKPDLESEFNPDVQEVIDFIEDNTNNIIKKVVSYGIKLNGRLITPAKVILTKKFSN